MSRHRPEDVPVQHRVDPRELYERHFPERPTEPEDRPPGRRETRKRARSG